MVCIPFYMVNRMSRVSDRERRILLYKAIRYVIEKMIGLGAWCSNV